MNEHCEPIDHKLLVQLLKNIHPDEQKLVFRCTQKGEFELFLQHRENCYRLQTQRKERRLFKNPKTALSYIAQIGGESVFFEKLSRFELI